MHYLRKLAEDTEKTHANLGNALAFAQVVVKARKCLLVTAPAGIGKSTIGNTLGRSRSDKLVFDSITRSGLRAWEDALSNFKGIAIIDDLGKVDTNYSRIQTITTFAELCYSHFVSKWAHSFSVQINNFQGGAILNIQPVVLAALVNSDEWEAVVADKTVRYYHLYRPITPCRDLPEVALEWGVDFDTVADPKQSGKQWRDLVEIGTAQWSDSRVLEHTVDLLKAAAALDGRTEVKKSDYLILLELMRPLTLERHLIDKVAFEAGRIFQNDLLAVIVEIASWGEPTIERVARDYRLPVHRAISLVANIGSSYIRRGSKINTIVASKQLTKILQEAGAETAEGRGGTLKKEEVAKKGHGIRLARNVPKSECKGCNFDAIDHTHGWAFEEKVCIKDAIAKGAIQKEEIE